MRLSWSFGQTLNLAYINHITEFARMKQAKQFCYFCIIKYEIHGKGAG